MRKITRRYSREELVERGMLTDATAEQLTSAVRSGCNILISGGTGTGKTTLLNALADRIPDSDRIAQTPLGHEIPLPAVTISDLVRATLRHRSDRIIVGEVRGAEAFDLLQALNTGHLGSLSTIHANSADQALRRFAHCV